MSWMRVFGARVRGLFGRETSDRELDEEVRFHLETLVDDNVKAGMKPEAARDAALRSFGPVEPMKETYRDGRSLAPLVTTAQDLMYAVRTLRHSPGFTATSVAVLALAIGANTAMFSVLNALILRPLPYPSPEQLVMLWTQQPSGNAHKERTAYWNVEQWRTQSQSFVDMAFFDDVSATLNTADRAEKISVLRTSPNLLRLLGVEVLHGRVFTAEEAEQRQRLALISHRFWQTHFGGSFDAIGANVLLDGVPSRIIGILPPQFRFVDDDIWEPFTMYPDWEAVRRARGAGFWAVIARLRPGVTVGQARAEMNTIALRLDEQMPPTQRRRGVSVVPLSQQIVGARTRLALGLLAGAVFLVLLIAATNVASLSLARSASRGREIAIRAALGASRARIVRQLLAESMTVAMAAGLLGLGLAYIGVRLILAVRPGNLARIDEVSLDPYVLGCALALCLLTGILVGLAPAIQSTGRDVVSSLQEGGRGMAGGRASLRTRRVLVVAEFAMAVVLLIGAGLLVRSLVSVQKVDLGFDPHQVLSVALAAPVSSTPAQRLDFYQRVLEQVQSLPGVESASITSELMMGGTAAQVLTAEGEAVSERAQFRSDELSEGLFTTLRTPLVRGRFFSAADGRQSAPVAIINEAMARLLWSGRDPVGKRFKSGAADSANPWFTVVGVVGDMRRQGLEKEPIPQMFEPLPQNPPRRGILLVRTSARDPMSVAGAVQAAVHGVEKYAPVYRVETLERQIDALLTERRFQTTLLTGFSAAAILIAAIGIYGLVQYSISTRTREIGIRIALGAQTSEIFRMVIADGLKLSAIGLAIGLVGAVWLGRAGSSLLVGISATDPLTFLAVSLLLMGTGVLACCLPARRAMKVEPTVALRQ